ncbi:MULTISPECIES: flagellar export protein FliJ [unclassified Paenibacillus]|uniref:flagellar export protein FliJ n=1 Tax=unclassified Paenibacillus TaxID=185978 RepID=UPI002F41C8F7
MAAFHYSFQKVVDLKTSEKTQAEWILSSDLSVLHSEELSLKELEEAKKHWEDKLHEASHGGASLSELQMIQQYTEYLHTRIEAKLKDVRKAQIAVDKSRSKLADRMKDEKVWLKAKENAYERFRHDVQLKEQNELDELATARFMVTVP